MASCFLFSSSLQLSLFVIDYLINYLIQLESLTAWWRTVWRLWIHSRPSPCLWESDRRYDKVCNTWDRAWFGPPRNWDCVWSPEAGSKTSGATSTEKRAMEENQYQDREHLDATPSECTVQQKTDRLMAAVLEAVHTLTPKAKPSQYAKRWWTTDLTQLRHILILLLFSFFFSVFF